MALSTEQKTKMWAMLNQTRGQIGLTAYKDYIFGILFYKYLSEKATHWLNAYYVVKLGKVSILKIP
ncbi:type I restriction-modification system subunit M N-terminal domain-containing protein [Listeria monocytogenes]|uniref:type I restriction-modification system subunit M N-terminal domain-containing protein n=1 Tax=Listeria monocytogenes TaxID=1639 RepID=UPI001F2FEC43|nr:type I restriction-modification system subunit M N-terminal domain-containing protein [Listeria monocytogenes]